MIKLKKKNYSIRFLGKTTGKHHPEIFTPKVEKDGSTAHHSDSYLILTSSLILVKV